MQSTSMKKIIAKLLTALLVMALTFDFMPSFVCVAADDNDTSIGDFPFGVTADSMINNNGTINYLRSYGTVENNNGTITNSEGIVLINNATIDTQGGGNIGINKGTVNNLTGTTSYIGVNESTGIVGICLSTVVRNEGTITTNAGIIEKNYGTIGENTGTVTMREGSVTTNKNGGKIYFEAKETSPAIVFSEGTVTKNEGIIEIENGEVTVTTNTGTITLKEGATLNCENNLGTITKADGISTYTCNCLYNYGQITFNTSSNGDPVAIDEFIKIVFNGDDGKAVATLFADEFEGVKYTAKGLPILFTLPDAYRCVDATLKSSSEGVNNWSIITTVEDGEKEFKIICHECGKNKVTDAYVAPTYDATGLTEGAHCSICERVLIKQDVIPKLVKPDDDDDDDDDPSTNPGNNPSTNPSNNPSKDSGKEALVTPVAPTTDETTETSSEEVTTTKNSTEEVKTEAPTEEVTAEIPTEEIIAETPTEEIKTENLTEEVKTEDQTTEKSLETQPKTARKINAFVIGGGVVVILGIGFFLWFKKICKNDRI